MQRKCKPLEKKKIAMLANIRVRQPVKTKSWELSKKTKGSSLKNLQNVRYQIQNQEKFRKQLDKASQESKMGKVSMQLQSEVQKAFAKLRGEKVHDDMSILRKAEKRLKRKKVKSAEAWDKRKDSVKKSQLERADKRKENIAKFRGSLKKKAVRLERVSETTPAKKVETRKIRRHENLMKYGPKKDRAEREEKRKGARKARRADKKPDRPSKLNKASKSVKK